MKEDQGCQAAASGEAADQSSSAGARRFTCPACGKSKGAYCEDCVLVLEQPAPPQLRLPIKVDIVQHGETNARSTALHAALLAPLDVVLHRHTDSKTSRRCNPLDLQLPSFDPATTVVLFPEGPGTDVVGQCAPFERVVVLESNWKKAPGLLRHPALSHLRRVQLRPDVRTEFSWRRGDGSFRGAVDEGLSSIEAIQHCCRLLGSPGESYFGLLHYFLRTKELVESRGPLPTSRQEARACKQQQQQQQVLQPEGDVPSQQQVTEDPQQFPGDGDNKGAAGGAAGGQKNKASLPPSAATPACRSACLRDPGVSGA